MAISVIVGLDTAEKHRLLDQRITLETNCQVGRNELRIMSYEKREMRNVNRKGIE